MDPDILSGGGRMEFPEEFRFLLRVEDEISPETRKEKSHVEVRVYVPGFINSYN